MKKKLHSEYVFIRELSESKTIFLTVYINHDPKSYDIVQNGQEGIFCRDNVSNTAINIAYMELAIEALKFIETELFNQSKEE